MKAHSKLAVICLGLVSLTSAWLAAQTSDLEIDAGRILWQAHKNTEKYLGRPVKILPPRIPAEGWEYQYRDGSGTVGSKQRVLSLVYRYKNRPKDIKEALRKVGLPTGTPPLDFGTSFIWPARGFTTRPFRFKGKTLNRVILAKDFSEIEIDGHKPGSY